jgi:hypothetical protein
MAIDFEGTLTNADAPQRHAFITLCNRYIIILCGATQAGFPQKTKTQTENDPQREISRMRVKSACVSKSARH